MGGGLEDGPNTCGRPDGRAAEQLFATAGPVVTNSVPLKPCASSLIRLILISSWADDSGLIRSGGGLPGVISWRPAPDRPPVCWR
jgi:hypothetical protein